MLDVVLTQIRGVARGWQREAADMKRITPTNPVADTTEYRASELLSVVEQIEKDTQLLTTAQFAKLHRKTPQTVTGWVRDKKVPGIPGPNGGYLIPRSAPAPTGRRRAKRGAK